MHTTDSCTHRSFLNTRLKSPVAACLPYQAAPQRATAEQARAPFAKIIHLYGTCLQGRSYRAQRTKHCCVQVKNS